MASIFVSYRRSDSVAWARLLRDSFAHNLSGVRIFRDLDAILPGDNFAQIIADAVASCDMLIALIGPTWVSAVNPVTGARRLLDPNDFTRIEVVTALKRGVRVIPVLVGGATMPTRDDLPEDLQPLCERQNIELSDRSWDDGCLRLAEVLARMLPPQPPATSPSPPTPLSPAPLVSPTARRVVLAAGGAGALAAFLGWMRLRRTPDPGQAPVWAPGIVAATPSQQASSQPRPPSLLDVDLTGTWRPFTAKTPKLLVHVKPQQGALALVPGIPRGFRGRQGTGIRARQYRPRRHFLRLRLGWLQDRTASAGRGGGALVGRGNRDLLAEYRSTAPHHRRNRRGRRQWPHLERKAH